MSGQRTSTTKPTRGATIRNEPVQARSTARLSGLLDAAAAVVEEIGYERLTTAMIAERANASIGTVYRYFPDRIAVLLALAERNFERVSARIREEAADESHRSWREAVVGIFDDMVACFRDEPGYRSLRLGDVLDLRPPAEQAPASARLAAVIRDALAERFDIPDDAEFVVNLESTFEVADALLARAFFASDRGDEKFIARARAWIENFVDGRLPVAA